jgi:hypothetical protein
MIFLNEGEKIFIKNGHLLIRFFFQCNLDWWSEDGAYYTVFETSKTREYHDLLLRTSSIDAIVKHCVEYAKQKNLPLLNEEQWKEHFWVSKPIKSIYKEQMKEKKEGNLCPFQYKLNIHQMF